MNLTTFMRFETENDNCIVDEEQKNLSFRRRKSSTVTGLNIHQKFAKYPNKENEEFFKKMKTDSSLLGYFDDDEKDKKKD